MDGATKLEKREVTVSTGLVDLPFLILTLLLVAIGLIMLFSASYASAYYEMGNPTYYFVKQLIFAAGGLAIMFVISKINYQSFRALAFPVLGFSILCLLLVLIIGTKVNDAKRWIDLGPFGFQPSEIAKLGVILTFSAMISMYKEKMKTFRYGVLPFIGILVPVAGLIMLEPHLSGTILVLAVGAALLFVGGADLKWFALAGIAAAIGFILVVFVFGYGSARIATWRDPFAHILEKGWQTVQSLYAIGSGGLLGLGLGNSRQKFLYLPEEQNDFIFAIVCEELGYIGAVVVLILFALLIIRGYWLALHARDRFGSLLIIGITTHFAVQVFLNVAVVTNFFPVTGISLPFFSAGGTSLMMQLVEMGIVLSVSRHNPIKKLD